MQRTATQPWKAKPDWDTPCGKSLNKLIGLLNKKYKEPISVFLTSGSWFQMVVDPEEPTKDLDVIVCRNGSNGDLVPIAPKEIEPELKKSGLLMGSSSDPTAPYVDILPPDGVLISSESIDRMSYSFHKNVRLGIQNPADWVAMHTPPELQKNNRIKRTVENLKRPTEREYVQAVNDIGGKCVIAQWVGDERIPISICGHDVKKVISVIKGSIKLHGAEVHFGV